MKRSEIKQRPLSDTVLANLEPEGKAYRVHDGNGLYLRVKPNGTKTWELRYRRDDGKWSWIGVGRYGNGSAKLTGKQARQAAAKLCNSAQPGQDMLATKRMRLMADRAAAQNTFEKLAREWYAGKRMEWTDGTAVRIIGSLEKHVFPVFGKRPYSEIQPIEWMQLLRRMAASGIVEQTSRVRAACRSIYGLAKVTGRMDYNPLEGMHEHLPTKPKQNYAHVEPDELPALLRAIRACDSPDIGIALQLLAMLACRPSELREAVWSEFDLNEALWTIPAGRMKRRREHLVPLPDQAVALLTRLHSITGRYAFLFPGRSDVNKPRSNTAFVMALRRMGYGGRQTAHGFRHIASTALNEQGFDSDHIEAQLSHVKDGVAGTYNKARYLAQRREMMQWWANRLDALAAGNVVRMRA